MAKVIPFSEEERIEWKLRNRPTIEGIDDRFLKLIVAIVIDLSDVEAQEKWKDLGYSSFEKFLYDHSVWDAQDFNWVQKAVFERLGDVKRHGLGATINILKQETERK